MALPTEGVLRATARRRFRERPRAAALVEMALCAPILLMVLSGVIEFGFMIWASMQISDAAREGARWGAKGRDDATVISICNKYAPARSIRALTVAVKVTDATGNVLSDSSTGVNSPPGNRLPGARISVTVSCGVQWLTPLQAWAGGTTYGLSALKIYRVENP